MEDEANDLDAKEPKYYELGFLLTPLTAEDKVSEELGAIIALVEKHNGKIVTSVTPTLRSLAYPIKKETDRKWHTFTTSFFGWIKFEILPEQILRLKTDLGSMPAMLRFLIVTTSKMAWAPRERKNPSHRRPTEETPAVSGEEMDREIDALIASTEDKIPVL